MKRILLLLLCPALAFANNVPCEVRTPRDILSCALKQHPEVLRAEGELRAASAMRGEARQIPNPEVSAESASFHEGDEPATKIEATYLHPFELGGKRAARIGEAAGRERTAQARLALAREQVASETLLKLTRVRQLRDEIRLVDEALATFKRIVSSYTSRPRRSGEQDISLSVFRMAQSDYEFRKSALLQERAELNAFFELAVQHPLSDIADIAPAARREWPVMETRTLQSAQLQKGQAELAVAEAGLHRAQGQAWPDLMLGPRLESASGRGQSAQGYGAAMSLNLPLYQRNAGGKRAAQAGLDQAKLSLEQTTRELAAEQSKWQTIYTEAVRSYKEAPLLEEIEKHHSQSERLFERGLIQPALIIEAHRQMVDLAKSRHEQEQRALEALWQLYALEGRAMEERL